MEFFFIWLRDLDTKKIGVEAFGELHNLVLKGNGDKRANEVVLELI